MVSRAIFLVPDNSCWHSVVFIKLHVILFNEVLNNKFPKTNPVVISKNQSCGAKFTFGTRKLVPLSLDFNTPAVTPARSSSQYFYQLLPYANTKSMQCAYAKDF